jgi:DNA-binding GntR family transcriptional regulator/transposase-like protein
MVGPATTRRQARAIDAAASPGFDGGMSSTPKARLAWIAAYEQGQDAVAVCARFGIAPATLRKWWKRYREGGAAALADRDRAPRTSPTRKAGAAEAEAIRNLRARGLSLSGIRAALLAEHTTELSIPTIRRVLARELPAPVAPRPRPTQPRAGIVSAGTLEEELSAAIAEAIGRGRYRPGEKLTEEGLARDFGTGRTRVREALRSLAHLGLVTLERHRGASVAFPSEADLARAYEARRTIEAGVLEQVAHRCDHAGIATLRAHIARQEDALATGNRLRFVQLLTDFHLVLGGLAGNPFLLGFLERLVAVTSLSFLIKGQAGDPHCAVAEHAGIVDALAQGRLAEARALMNAHLGGGRVCEPV